MSRPDHKIHVTFFRDQYAMSLSSAELTKEELAARIQKATASTKDKLPWLKLAKFGRKPADKDSKCLRYDKNVVEVTGIELDYDEMKVTFAEAVECIRSMGIAAIVYTSPSHQNSKPKWRVLAPTSKPIKPDERRKLVARLNGAMGRPVNKVESFTLSQSYYFGQAADNPAPNHQVIVLDGEYIDKRTDLGHFEKLGMVGDDDRTDAGASNHFTEAAEEDGFIPEDATQHGFEAILAKIGDGLDLVGFNNALHRAAASYVALHNGNPFDREKLKELLRDAAKRAPIDPNRDPATIKRYLSDKYLNDVIKTATKKFVEKRAVKLDDFVAVMKTGQYLFKATRDMWPAKSVNARIPPIPLKNSDGSFVIDPKTKKPVRLPASTWLDKYQPVEQIAWAPGEPEIVRDRLLQNEGGWIHRPGNSTFNMYLAPTLVTTGLVVTAADIEPWLGHLQRIYPEDWQHLLMWLAHRVQHPEIKINHAIVLGGKQGIGKDTLLEPIKHAVGPWNFTEVGPEVVLGRFNGFLKSVVLRVSEARDLGGNDRYKLYERLKTVTAAPPDTLRVDEKNLREHPIINVVGVIITTNHKTGGIYLPPDDRRTFAAWSYCEKEQFDPSYWVTFWHWYNNEDGIRKVAAYLRNYDVSSFDPKAPPPRTAFFDAIVGASLATEEIELANLIERMDSPDALTITQLSAAACKYDDMMDLASWLDDRDNRKAIPHRLEQCDYERCTNPDSKQGLWPIKAKVRKAGQTGQPHDVVESQKQAVYAKTTLPRKEQVEAVRKMIRSVEP